MSYKQLLNSRKFIIKIYLKLKNILLYSEIEFYSKLKFIYKYIHDELYLSLFNFILKKIFKFIINKK